MITPTVGRVVWFRPGTEDRYMMEVFGNDPLRADVIYVRNPTTVNLSIIDHGGQRHTRTGVALMQEEQKYNPHARRSYCEWMPYQKAVAKGEISPTLHAAAPLLSTKPTELDSH